MMTALTRHDPLMERLDSLFDVLFSLPKEVDEEKAEARFVDGVLELKRPKKSAAAGCKLETR